MSYLANISNLNVGIQISFIIILIIFLSVFLSFFLVEEPGAPK